MSGSQGSKEACLVNGHDIKKRVHSGEIRLVLSKPICKVTKSCFSWL